MTFLDMGIPEGVNTELFHIDGVDISEKSLKKAREGVYGRESFRGEDLSFRDRYFDKISVPGKNTLRKEETYRVHKPVRNIVRFIKGNALERRLLSGEKPYDIIFCRNLFIYLSEPAKRKIMELIDRLLAKDGILFVGHVERPLICASTETVRFVWIRQSGVFACRRAGSKKKKHEVSNAVQNQAIHKPEMRRQLSSKPAPVYRPVPAAVLPSAAFELRTSASDLPPVSDTGADALLKTARELADKGFLNEAFQLCDKCLNEDPFNSRAHFLTGLICHARSDEERAEEHFNKTVYLDPNHHEAMSHLAFIMERRGDFSRAEHLRRRVQRILQKEEKD
jgi:chemotaxis protein methyltransferase WspC